MEIFKGIKILDLALYIEDKHILIISDLQIGFEESLSKQGVLVPRFQYKDIVDRLEIIFSKVGRVDKVVINGDLKHEFGNISKQEWKEITRLMDYLSRRSNEIVVVKGNHDIFLKPITDKKEVKIVDEYVTNDIIMMHGHKISENIKNKKLIIIGHEHPAVSLREGVKAEKFKCFLKGRYGRSALIVQPSFNPLIEGTDVTKEELLSPFLHKGIKDFEVFVVDERERKTRYFGRLGEVF